MSNPSHLPACPECFLENTYPVGDSYVGPASDHEVDCKTDPGDFMLKAEFMKKA